jgi:streptogramin lyase
MKAASLRRKWSILSGAVIGVIFSLAFVGQAWGAVEVAEFDLAEGGPITSGPEGALWFAPAGRLGRAGVDGKVDELTLSGQTGYPQDITAGPDGNLWISTSEAIDRVTTKGALTEFPLPDKNELPGKIVVGADGNLWFTLWVPAHKVRGVEERTGAAFIVRITPSGAMTRFELPGPARVRNAAPAAIVAGPDGNLWFTDPALGRIGKITLAGAIAEYDLDVSPYGLTAGPDGNLWFTSSTGIGRISTTGDVREFPSRARIGGQIVTGPEADLWFTGPGLSVGRMTPSGQFSWFGFKGGAATLDIAVGSDGGIWATTSTNPIKGVLAGSLSRITPGAPGVEVVSVAATVHGGRVALELACGGSASGCTGNLRIGEGKRPVASSTYSLAPESTGVVTLSLSASAARLLARERFLRERVAVDAEGGVGGGSTVVLRRPHPLRGAPRPGRSLLMPLPEGYGGCCIALGWDGHFWLSGATGSLTRVTPTGELSDFRIPAFEREPGALVAGPRRSMWFLEEDPNVVVDSTPLLGRVAADGTFSEIPLPKGPYAEDLAVGPDGNLWVARSALRSGEVDRVTPAGKVTRFRMPGETAAITAGPERSVWFALDGTTIGRIGPRGKLRKFDVPGRGFIDDMTRGPDGNLWYTHWGRRGPPTIGRMTPAGQVAEFPLHERGRPGGTPATIIAGPDGNLWFTEYEPAGIGRITPQGKITRWRRAGAAAGSIAVGPEGSLWFSSEQTETIAVLASASARRRNARPGL